MPEHIRSDCGQVFTAWSIREWLCEVGARTPIHPFRFSVKIGERYVERFNRKLRGELLDLEVFYTLLEVRC